MNALKKLWGLYKRYRKMKNNPIVAMRKAKGMYKHE
jgi:hypothetical protein